MLRSAATALTDRRVGLVAAATLVLPAVVVVPARGIDPGFQLAAKTAMLALCACALTWMARRSGARTLSTEERLLVALAVLAGVSTLVAGSGLAAGLPVLLCAACLPLVARGARLALRGRWRAVEAAVCFAAVAVAALALLELLGLHLPWTRVRRPESTLLNRNHLAGYLAMALPVVAAAALRRRSFALPIAAAVTAVIVVTRCRSAYLGVAVAAATAAAAYAWHARRGRAALDRRALLALGGAIGAGAVLGLLPWPGVRFTPSVTDAAGRLFEYESGSGLARLSQHRLGFEALGRDPIDWLAGLGAGTWERVASSHAHVIGDHAPRFTGAVTPNSELLRILVEQGLAGLALLGAAWLCLARRLLARAAEPRALLPAIATLASVTAAGVAAALDPVLVRPECVALLGVLIGATAARQPATSAPPARSPRYALFALAGACAALALLRAGSFAASSPLGLAASVGAPAWEARQALAQALLRRPAIDERVALVRAARGRCAEAEEALERFAGARPHHWGARAAVAQCFARQGEQEQALRIWRGAFEVEPHLSELLARTNRDPTTPRARPPGALAANEHTRKGTHP